MNSRVRRCRLISTLTPLRNAIISDAGTGAERRRRKYRALSRVLPTLCGTRPSRQDSNRARMRVWSAILSRS